MDNGEAIFVLFYHLMMSASQRAFKAVKRPASGSLLRIVSYNVLANKYVLTGYHNYHN